MLEKLEEAGCPATERFFNVESCSEAVGGGFRLPDGVVICSNHLSAQEEVSHALTHELIHAYDHCRGADLDWTNCEHHACSEIRAASLSGDCHFKQELLRGNTGFRGQHQRCVRRRAELSVGMNPHCKGPGRAKQAVEQTFEQCFADTAPFDRIP
ncbi:mitochondrial inner membrane protease ATP23 [Coccomyxa sp. Obi]|nr:mitochondrial inner membrane protease ATP23 [Coccomyxa sp. Obi]